MRKLLLSAAFVGLAASMSAQDFKWQPFYTQTYENVAKVSDVWAYPSLNTSKTSVFEIAEDENGNHYVNCNVGNDNGRGLYNLDEMTAEMYEGIDEYRVEFDLALAGGNNQATTSFSVGSPDVQTMGSDWSTPCGAGLKFPNNNIGSGSLFSLFQTSTGGVWRVYSQGALPNDNWEGNPYLKDEIKITLTDNTMYHYAVTVVPASEEAEWDADVTVEITDANGEPVIFTVTEMLGEDEEGEEKEVASVTLPYTNQGNGIWFKQFYCLMGRYNGGMKIDNVQVMKKVDAASVTPPTLSMTGVKMEGRVIALDNGAETGLTPYYAVVDEATYLSATSAEGIEGTEYTEPFVVSAEVNYVLAWNTNAEGKASELTKFSCEAGIAIKLNAPTISASDYVGYKKTYVASCDQSDIKPLAPLSYTIFMSTDSLEWIETSTLTVEAGKVYAKVEADGYASAACAGIEAPEGAYGSTKWSVEGLVITKNDGILDEEAGTTIYDFGNSGKGRVVVDVKYWSEDVEAYDAEHAIPFLKKNGLHFHDNGTTNAMFLLGSGNANGYTINGVCVYNYRNSYITIDNLHEGDLVQVIYNDGKSNVLTVEDPETFQIGIPMYGNGAISAISIKGEGTVETIEVKNGEWGIVTSSRNVVDVDRAGATFYEHTYTMYDDETHATDMLILSPVKALEAGKAYIYKATADAMELVTLAAEEPVDEQSTDQIEFESETFMATLDDTYEDDNLYVFYGDVLMKSNGTVTVPEYSGYFVNLDGEFGDIYDESLDYKKTAEYEAFLEKYNKAVEDYNNADPEYDEETGEQIEKEELDEAALYAEMLNEQLGKYAVVSVVHEYDEKLDPAVKVVAPKANANALVNVVTPTGIVVRRGVKPADALNGLQRGLYIVGSKKIVK